MHKICEKRPIDPSQVTRALNVKEDGLRIMIDDDVVSQLQEGQSMIVEIKKELERDESDSTEDVSVELLLKY